MNRYEIRSKLTGQIFDGYFAEVAADPNPAWGDPSTYDVLVTDLAYEAALNLCHAQRAAEYPPVADLADALVHAQMGDNTQLNNYYAACEAVKQKYPKPAPPAA